ncbi:MAG TPA: hypothetical protein VD841_01200, partial [Arthrobacter sp.]|nr:hypothetical protein [Arthrobacter sp.]
LGFEQIEGVRCLGHQPADDLVLLIRPYLHPAQDLVAQIELPDLFVDIASVILCHTLCLGSFGLHRDPYDEESRAHPSDVEHLRTELLAATA